jgi:hypothetical protein
MNAWQFYKNGPDSLKLKLNFEGKHYSSDAHFAMHLRHLQGTYQSKVIDGPYQIIEANPSSQHTQRGKLNQGLIKDA